MKPDFDGDWACTKNNARLNKPGAVVGQVVMSGNGWT